MTNSPNQYKTVRIVERLPSVEDYCRLRSVAGLSPRSREAAARGLPNSVYSVIACTGERTIGMGRIIGDWGSTYQIVDMAVEPEHQGRGIGSRIMDHLMDYLKRNAPESAYVSLIADVDGFYEKYGFQPVAPRSNGMFIRME